MQLYLYKLKQQRIMTIVKPPYKFRSPYWTNDELGKQKIRYRFGFLDFGSIGRKGGFKEVGNSEKNYYKNCTRDLSRKDLYTLMRELREGFIMSGASLMKSMSTNTGVLDMLTNGKPLENKEYTWNLLKQ